MNDLIKNITEIFFVSQERTLKRLNEMAEILTGISEDMKEINTQMMKSLSDANENLSVDDDIENTGESINVNKWNS